MTPYWLAHALHILETTSPLREDLQHYDPSEHYLIRQGVFYALQTIAESAHKLPQEVKKAHPHIDWQFWRELRNELAHDYLQTPSWQRMKGVIEHDVAVLFEALASPIPSWRSL